MTQTTNTYTAKITARGADSTVPDNAGAVDADIFLDGVYDAIELGEMVAPFVEQQSPERLTGPKSKLLFNDDGFEEHPDTDAAWLRGRL